MLAAKGSLKLCETERPEGVWGVVLKQAPGNYVSPPKVVWPPISSNLLASFNFSQTPNKSRAQSALIPRPARRKQKNVKKKKKDSSLRGRPETPARARSTASPSQPPGSRPSPSPGRTRSRRPRSSFPPRHRPRAAAPRTHPAPVTEYPGIRGPHFPVSAHPHPRHGEEQTYLPEK